MNRTTILLVSLEISLKKKCTSMRKFLGVLVIAILSLFALNAQGSVERISADTLKLNVQIKTTDIKLPIQDVSSIYNQINELKTSNKTEYDAMAAYLEVLSNKIDNVVYKENDAKISYITSNFGMTKDDISKAVQRTNTNKAISIGIPLLLLIYLWLKVLRVRHIEATHATLFVVIGLILSIVTAFLLYTGLQSLFNPDAAVLHQLQELL